MNWRSMKRHKWYTIYDSDSFEKAFLYPSRPFFSQGTVYTPLDVGAFERIGNQPNGSATQAVINDFMTRGYTVDDLFLMLNAIEHVEGMRVIRNHGNLNFVYPTTIHTTVLWSLEHTITWAHHHMSTPSHEHIITWTHHHMNTSSHEHITWAHHMSTHHMSISSHEHVITWTHHHMSISSHEHVITWAHHHMSTSSHEHVITWARHHMSTLSPSWAHITWAHHHLNTPSHEHIITILSAHHLSTPSLEHTITWAHHHHLLSTHHLNTPSHYVHQLRHEVDFTFAFKTFMGLSTRWEW